ncbi:MAG: exodeoxyribonuclease VII large subunit [Rhodothalassiaceae bacterium]
MDKRCPDTVTKAMAKAPANVMEFSVTEISQALKRAVERDFAHVRVRGELSGVKRAGSGHVYMCMKDDGAALDAVCWRGTAQQLRFRPEEGLEVVATGRLSTYPGRSKYQLIVEQLEPAGAGALMALMEERKKKLAAEGLFAPERKRPLPFLPVVIGIVTSPTGSVIRDILHRLSDRFPRHVLVWPVLVQGEGAAQQIAAAIDGFAKLDPAGDTPRPDLLIVARGGGSIEDLWAFNEEIVARAAAACPIPLISAVGHETDTTLIDYVADRRAPTPTAAAEIAVPVRKDLLAQVTGLSARLDQARRRFLQIRRDRLAGLARGLPRPRDLTGLARQQLDDLADRLPRGLTQNLTARRARLDRASVALTPRRLSESRRHKRAAFTDLANRLVRARRLLIERQRARLDRLSPALKPQPLQRRIKQDRKALTDCGVRLATAAAQRRRDAAARLDGLVRVLESLSYKNVLARGYAVLRDEHGGLVTRAAALSAAQTVEAEFADGRRDLVVAGRKPAKARASGRKEADQGSLL